MKLGLQKTYDVSVFGKQRPSPTGRNKVIVPAEVGWAGLMMRPTDNLRDAVRAAARYGKQPKKVKEKGQQG